MDFNIKACCEKLGEAYEEPNDPIYSQAPTRGGTIPGAMGGSVPGVMPG